MTLELLLQQKNLSKYKLSKISGIPKTTIMDICSGKSSIGKCTGRTIQQLAIALNCTMEEIMELETPGKYDAETNLPMDKSYLECGLPTYLLESVNNMKESWAIIDSGRKDLHWDIYWSELNADINSAEVDYVITSEQAWYLRETYLRIKKGE